MKTNRRKFIATAITGGIAAALPLSSRGYALPNPGSDIRDTDYSRLDEILKKPVFKKELFTTPVIIETLELLRFKDSFLCRVRKVGQKESLLVTAVN